MGALVDSWRELRDKVKERAKQRQVPVYERKEEEERESRGEREV